MSGKKLFIIFAVTFAVSLLIAFNVSPYLRGPAPYPPENRWEYIFVNTADKLWAPIAVFLLVLYLYKRSMLQMDKKTFNAKIFLFKLILLGAVFNLAILYFSRSGVGVLFRRVALPEINGQFETAITIKSFPEYVRNLERLIPSLPLHSNTHPPGMVGFYFLLNKLICSVPVNIQQLLPAPKNTGAILFESLNVCQRGSAYLISLLSLMLPWLTVIPVFYISKLVFDEEKAVTAAFLYLFIPALVMFVPIADTYYSLFPLSAFYFLISAMKAKSRYLYLLSGLIFSMGLFFSFSVIPVLIIFYLFLLLSFMNKEILFKEFTEALVYFTVALLTVPGLLLLTDVNYIRLIETVSVYIAKRSYLPWLFFNLYDFFVLLGIPYFLLFLYSSVKNFSKPIISGSFQKKLNLCFWVMIILLDVSGFVRAETSRIWLPFVPFIVILVSDMFSYRPGFNKFIIFVTMQFIFLLLIQEFWAVQS